MKLKSFVSAALALALCCGMVACGGAGGNASSDAGNASSTIDGGNAGGDSVDISNVKISEDYFVWEGNTITRLSESGKEQKHLIIPERCEGILDCTFQTDPFLAATETAVETVSFESNRNIALAKDAFWGAHMLKSITLPADLIPDPELNFSGCKALEHFELPQATTSIAKGAFFNCESLQTIDIPSGVTTIGGNAFDGCLSLQSVILPEAITTIPLSLFRACESLESVTFQGVIVEIESAAFEGCAFESFDIPDTVTKLGHGVFAKSSKLTTVTFPDTIIEMGDEMFQDCTQLQNVKLSNIETTIYKNMFEGCTALTNVVLPDSITEIQYNAFGNCESLTELTLPKSIKTLDGNMLIFTNFKTITVPAEVELETFQECGFLQMDGELTVSVKEGSWFDVHFAEVCDEFMVSKSYY